MENILIVEDDQGIRKLEKDYLLQNGFNIFEASNGKEALNLFKKQSLDLIILDLNIPVLDGITVCKKIRETSSIPIIMVTAKTKEIDELIGLEVGADDYIKKPFSPRVLVSRVKTILKRPKQIDPQILKYKQLTLNKTSRQIYKNGKPIELTSIQFDILYKLLKIPGKVYTREELMQIYSNSNDIYDRTIDAHIKNIRKKIEANPKKPQYILTVRGVGYKSNEQT